MCRGGGGWCQESRGGLCLLAEVNREPGGALKSTLASATRLGMKGSCVHSVCALGTVGLGPEGGCTAFVFITKADLWSGQPGQAEWSRRRPSSPFTQ